MTSIALVAGLAVVIYMATQLVKTIIDVAMGKVAVKGKQVLKRKSDPRKYAWLNRIVLPALPPALGMLLGALVPFRPEFLIEYVTANLDGIWVTVTYAAYGGVVGNFAETIYTKVKKALADYKHKP